MFEMGVEIKSGDVNLGELIGKFEGEWQVEFLAPHAVPVEFGTDPHYPGRDGVKNLEKWAHSKLGLTTKEAKKAAQAIAWKIFHKGTEPQPFLRPAVDEANFRIKQLIKDDMGLEDIADFIYGRAVDIINERGIADKGTLASKNMSGVRRTS